MKAHSPVAQKRTSNIHCSRINKMMILATPNGKRKVASFLSQKNRNFGRRLLHYLHIVDLQVDPAYEIEMRGIRDHGFENKQVKITQNFVFITKGCARFSASMFHFNS